MKLIAQGAEARLFLEGNSIIKQRARKSYRIAELDGKLRGFRTRREAKVLKKLGSINFPSPRLIASDDEESITLSKINGKLLRDALEKYYADYSRQIGENIAVLHNNGIIHGDLTTSNMILSKNSEGIFADIYFIDFGLSFFSDKAEDKAVDLHLLKEALESKHHAVWEKCFKIVLEFYKKSAHGGSETLKRLEVVEKRGRYRAKKGN